MAMSKASNEARKLAEEKKAAKEGKTKVPETKEDEGKKKKKKKKKEPGKLPKMDQGLEGDSKTAADEVLRKFFNSR